MSLWAALLALAVGANDVCLARVGAVIYLPVKGMMAVFGGLCYRLSEVAIVL